MIVGSLSWLDPTKLDTPQDQKPHRRSSPVCHHSMAEFSLQEAKDNNITEGDHQPSFQCPPRRISLDKCEETFVLAVPFLESSSFGAFKAFMLRADEST